MTLRQARHGCQCERSTAHFAASSRALGGDRRARGHAQQQRQRVSEAARREPMHRPRGGLIGLVLACASLFLMVAIPGAWAEDPAPPSPWSFQIVPYLWLAGIGGTISGPRASVDISAGIGDVL